MKSFTKRRRHTALQLLLLHQLLLYSYSFSFRPVNVSISSVVRTDGNWCTSSSPSRSSVNKLLSCRQNRRSRQSFNTHPLHSTNNNGDYDDVTNENESSSSTKSPSSSSSRSKLKDLYAILNAKPTMTRSQIKQCYLTLAKQCHPDSNTYNPSLSLSFTEISSAYQTLSDDKLRKRYDRQVAAEEFKGDVVAYAAEVAREYGPMARKLYDEWALPLIKRTTAGTVAGLSVLGSGSGSNSNDDDATTASSSSNDRSTVVMERTRIMGSTTSSPLVDDEEQQTITNNGKKNNNNNSRGSSLQDFGKAFVRVIEASRNATRQIDGAELQEKSVELRQRADEARAESLLILEQLSSIQNERLRLTLHTTQVEFTSEEALKFLNGFQSNVVQRGDGNNNNNNNGGGRADDDSETMGIMGRMGFKHTLREDIDTFRVAEEEFRTKLQEKQDIDYKQDLIIKELERAEKNTRDAEMELDEAKKRLEQAQQQLASYQTQVTEIQRNISNMNASVKRADQELSRSDQHLKRKRDVVRRALKRKDDMYNNGEFAMKKNTISSSLEDNTIGNGYDNNAASMNNNNNNVEYNNQNNNNNSMLLAQQIDQLRKEEAGMESEFLMLVEKASRLVSRSERLRIRSEALIGNQSQQQQQQNGGVIMEQDDNTDDEQFASNGGTVIGDNFNGTI